MTTTTTTARRGAHAMSSDLGEHTVQAAAAAAHQTWDAMNLHPGNTPKALKLADALTAWAGSHDVATLADLTGDVALNAILDVADVDKLAGLKSPKKLETLHRVRNTITALRGTVLVTDPVLERKRSHRPGGDRLDAGIPDLPARSNARRRALRDDEILLARLLVEIDLREGGKVLPIHGYCLGETGLMVMDNTKSTTADLDDLTAPTKVVCSGVWSFGKRTRSLDPFVSNVLTRTLPRLRPGTQPLSFSGEATPGTKEASASLTPTITRFLARAGIPMDGVTAKSLSLWRPDHILRTQQNFKKALKVHGGRKPENLLDDLNYSTDETDLLYGVITIRDHHGKPVARVRPKHLGYE